MFHIDKTFLKDLLFVKKLINTPDVYLNHYGMRFMVYLIAKTLAEKKTMHVTKTLSDQKLCRTNDSVRQIFFVKINSI